MRWILLAMLMVMSSSVVAEPWHKRGHGHGWHGWHHGHRQDPGTAFWGGVVGGVIGGLLGGGGRDDAEDRDEPDEMAPFTPAWYDHCRRKYRSFNADTGKYLGYDGELHLCK